MVPHNSEFTRKLRAAVRAKIEEFGIDVDDELPDYVMIMVGNKKDKVRMKTDLKLFLGDKTSDFVEWLFGFFQKVKSATSSTSVIAQQQQQKQDTIEMVSEKGKKQTTTGRTLDKGDEGGERATEKIPLTEENPTQHDRRGRMRESQSEKSTDRSKTINSLSVDSQTREEKIRPSRSKKRQLSPSSHRDAFPPTKSRSSSHNRSPQRNGRSRGVKQTPLDRTRPSLVLKTHGERSRGSKKETKTRPKNGAEKRQIGRKETEKRRELGKDSGAKEKKFMVSPTSRKSVVLPSKGPPALRSVVSVPVQFSPTVHPRVRAVARSPSPLPSSPSPFSPSPPRLLGSSPKVMLSGGIVPVMMKTATKRVKIVNQLDIAIATTQNEGLPQREETKADDAGEVMPRKQKVIRTAISPLPMNDQPNQTLDAATTKLARRRVIFGGGSLIFQRAIQQQQRTVATTVTSATSPQKTVPKAMVVVRPQIRMVTVASPDKAENKEDKEQAPAIEAIPTTTRPVQRRAMAVVAQQQTGVSLFQRAIKETKRQRTEGEDTEGIGKRPKRLSAEMLEPTDTEFVETEEEADAGEGKRPRIEREMHEKEKGEEEEKERVENEEKRNEKADKEKEVEEEDGEEKEEEVLTIDMSKGTGRKREIKRPPKFGLDLVKEHISGGQIAKDSRTKEEVTKKEHEQMEKGQQQISPLPLTDHRNEVPKNIQSPTDGQGGKENDNAERKVGKEMPETTVHFKRNWTSHASLLTTSAPIWDGRIEIDDMSSTDDEAEIDAVLADAQRLRKLALERELPPTAAMSRPLLYNPLDFSLSPESGLISPSDAALLPAVNYKQLMMLSSGSFFSEQKQQASSVNSSTSVVASSATDEAIISAVTVYVSSAASDGAQQLPQQRPHATVAPTTTIQAAPATMIVQQQYHYHHQNQQLRPRSHPYSQGYVVPTLTAHDYRYQVNRGSVSKVYTGGHKMQFALLQQQSVAMGNKDCLKQRLRLLREQHKQKTLSLQRHLEEQRLLLGQLQKMASTVELEQRKELLSRVRQMDVPIGKLKRELNEVCEQITKATKCDG